MDQQETWYVPGTSGPGWSGRRSDDRADEESEVITCPQCGIGLRSYRHDDPLRKHLDYCEGAEGEREPGHYWEDGDYNPPEGVA